MRQEEQAPKLGGKDDKVGRKRRGRRSLRSDLGGIGGGGGTGLNIPV